MRRSPREVPVQGISLDTTVPVAWAARELAPRPAPCACRAIWIRWRCWPTRRRCLAEAERIVAAYGDRPFIFNLGHGVSQETPPEAVAGSLTT